MPMRTPALQAEADRGVITLSRAGCREEPQTRWKGATEQAVSLVTPLPYFTVEMRAPLRKPGTLMSSSALIYTNTQHQARQLLPRPWCCLCPLTHQTSTPQAPPSLPQTDPSLDSILDSIWKLAGQGCLSEAFHAYSSLRHCSPSPHLVLHPISSLLACSTKLGADIEGRQLHAHLISLGFQCSTPLVSRLVAFYADCGAFDDAEAVAEGSSSGNSFTWNLLISAYVRAGFYWRGLLAYEGMLKRGVFVDNFTHSSVLKACGEMLDMRLGKKVHARMEKSGLARDLFVHNALLSVYAKCGELPTAEKLFEGMLERDIVSCNALIAAYVSNAMWEDASKFLERMRIDKMELNTVTWNTIIRGNLQMGNYVEALQLISQMKKNGPFLDSVTVVIALNACSRIGCLRLGKQIHGLVLRSHFDEDEIVINTLVTMYSRCSKIRYAETLFQTSRIRTSITWNCIIAGYAIMDQSVEASFLFQEMIQFGYQPSYVTILIILSLCGRVANLQHGKEMHCYIIRNRFLDQNVVWNSLIDMYCKSGKISEAWKVFDSMKDKDIFSYTSMIDGFGMLGEGRAALALFMDMTGHGIKPDHVTMVAVLSACCHAGLLNEGQLLFDNMARFYAVVPQLEHYSCMVGLYVCMGFLSKAEELLNRMPIQPTVEMWASLIWACQVYQNTEIGVRAAAKLLEMKPDNLWNYVLVANMYASAGCWVELSEVRKLARNLGFKVVLGCAPVNLGTLFFSYMLEDGENDCEDNIVTL